MFDLGLPFFRRLNTKQDFISSLVFDSYTHISKLTPYQTSVFLTLIIIIPQLAQLLTCASITCGLMATQGSYARGIGCHDNKSAICYSCKEQSANFYTKAFALLSVTYFLPHLLSICFHLNDKCIMGFPVKI